jgi:hypothetical protein
VQEQAKTYKFRCENILGGGKIAPPQAYNSGYNYLPGKFLTCSPLFS